jgi:hypothetical protein
LVTIQADASLIIDTGTPPEIYPGSSLTCPSPVDVQWLAGRFDLTETHNINAVEGWIARGLGGDITLAIYGNGNNVPDVNNEIFSGVFYVSTVLGVKGDVDWYGISGLNLSLPAGAYWAAFEVHEGSTFSGWMPGNIYENKIPNPLDNYAFNYKTDPAWYNNGYKSYVPEFGLRILADQSSVVPEPATLALFGIGSAAMAIIRKRKQAA